MDTSKEYIKMCEKAEEIQKAIPKYARCCFVWSKKLEEFAYGLIDTKNTVANFWGLFLDDVQCADNIPEVLIWLPRQDQLQEMVDKDWITVLSNFWDFITTGDESYESWLNEDFIKTFNSMEQLWLAFVMKEKYGKTWNGEKWVNNG